MQFDYCAHGILIVLGDGHPQFQLSQFQLSKRKGNERRGEVPVVV